MLENTQEKSSITVSLHRNLNDLSNYMIFLIELGNVLFPFRFHFYKSCQDELKHINDTLYSTSIQYQHQATCLGSHPTDPRKTHSLFMVQAAI